jgi:diguanylate cyclase (GGDEF)-like protein
MAQKRVLIVEDDPADAKMIVDLLTADGNTEYLPQQADRLDTALDYLANEQFDVVLLDLTLRDADGLEGIREISFILPRLPIVVLTDVDDDATALKAVQLGAQDYLVKKRDTGPAIRRVLRYAIERKRLEERIFHMATRDSLTQLPNRYLLMDRLTHAIDHASRAARGGSGGAIVAVLLLDLDNFRSLNDTLGHKTGDHLLVAVAERLKTAPRRSDTVGRMGGDEFIVILEDLIEPTTLSFHTPFDFDAHTITTTASIGISIYPTHATTSDDLLKAAEIAMYEAKKVRNCFRYYTTT